LKCAEEGVQQADGYDVPQHNTSMNISAYL